MALVMVIYAPFAINIHACINANAISFALVTTFFLLASMALQQGNAISVCDILLRSHSNGLSLYD